MGLSSAGPLSTMIGGGSPHIIEDTLPFIFTLFSTTVVATCEQLSMFSVPDCYHRYVFHAETRRLLA